MGHYNGNLQFQCELHYVPSSLFVTDAIWQVKADKCDCKWLNVHFKNDTGIFYFVATRKVLDVQLKKSTKEKLCLACLPLKPESLYISATGQTLPQV